MPSERSRPSAITGLNAARTKAMSISLQTCCRPFWMTASVTGSIFFISGPSRHADDDIAGSVGAGVVARLHHRGRIELLQDRGADKFAVQRQSVALVDRGLHP